MTSETVTVLVGVPDGDAVTVLVGDEEVEIIGSAALGPQGIRGKSAYQVAVDEGFVGTAAEWLASLQGAGGGLAYTHTQDSPSVLWTVAHNLDAFPNVTVVDTVGRQVEADVVWVDADTITVEFANPATGAAYLS